MHLNNFPALGIRTEELVAEIERLLEEARKSKGEWGAVNWGDLGVADVEYRLSMLRPTEPWCVVTIEEASPDCKLGRWITDQLDETRFPNTYVECEW